MDDPIPTDPIHPDLSHYSSQTNLTIAHSHIVDNDILEKVVKESVNIPETYHPPITSTTNVADTPQPATPPMLDFFQIFPFHEVLF